jgi:hypothetical protein
MKKRRIIYLTFAAICLCVLLYIKSVRDPFWTPNSLQPSKPKSISPETLLYYLESKPVAMPKNYLDSVISSGVVKHISYNDCSPYFHLELGIRAGYLRDVYLALKAAVKRNWIPKDYSFPFIFGDNQASYCNGYEAVIAKTRPLDANNIALISLDTNRHWKDTKTVKKYDKPFQDKNSCAVWRGRPNGTRRLSNNLRETLCKKWENSSSQYIDVAISYTKKHYWGRTRDSNYLSVRDMLQYKYIISIEGYDKDTGLQWKLYSNSVVLMPDPVYESWLKEFQLKPYVHYVPIKRDFSDLEEKVFWCESHPEECEKIAKNATDYVEAFFHEDQVEAQALVLKAFYEKLSK